MFQPDLFEPRECVRSKADAPVRPTTLDLPALLDRLTDVCERPRYSFMVLNLIAKASAETGQAGPFVQQGDMHLSVRDWLLEALRPLDRRAHHRTAMHERAIRYLAAAGQLPSHPEEREMAIAAELQRRRRHSGRTNVSRAVSELVRAGLVQRHYQGYRVDHVNRGAQRQAVYAVKAEVRAALVNAATLPRG